MKVYIDRIGNSLIESTKKAMDFIDWTSIIKPSANVFIKPNFTYPFYKKGVTTSPDSISALVEVLKDRTDNILIGESNGGNNAWQAEEAFEGHNLPEICKKYGVETVNLSKLPSEKINEVVGSRTVDIELPSKLLHEVDVFITMPIPKIHMMTEVSLAFKNQWGCIGDVKRLRYHHFFPEAITAVNRALKTKIAVFDVQHWLNRTGPMYGDDVEKNMMIVSDDSGAGSLAVCKLMKVDPFSVKHFRVLMENGMMPRTLEKCELSDDIANFSEERFYLERTLMNWFALAGFNSRILTTIGWDSPFARIAHKIVYVLRGKPEDVNPQW